MRDGANARATLTREMAPVANDEVTRCCIAGGGPAGVMVGRVPARAVRPVPRAAETRRLPQSFPCPPDPSLDARADARAGAARRIPHAAASTAHEAVGARRR